MEQHPVPQNITGFEFKLVGDMTIRQFVYLALGIGLGYLATLLPWADIFKWPVALTVGFTGFALAFMPIEERPLDKWFVMFFKAIYSPTQFIWKKTPQVLDWLILSQTNPPVSPPKEEIKRPETKLKEYLKTLPSDSKFPLDEKEDLLLQKLDFSLGNNFFPSFPPPFSEVPKEKEDEALPRVRVRKLKNPPISGEIIFPIGERKISKVDINLPKFPLEEKVKSIEEKSSFLTPASGVVTTPVKQISQTEEQVHPVVTPRIIEKEEKNEKREALGKDSKDELDRLKGQNETLSDQLKKFQEEINRLQEFAVQTTEGKIRLKEMLGKYEEALKTKERAIDEIANLRRKVEDANKQTVTPSAAPQSSPRVQYVAKEEAKNQGIPVLTQTPNVVSGIITDSSGQILSGVIVTIKDKQDSPVRAIKTNMVGQFKTGTPLSNGTYTIELEKEGYKFDIIAIEVKGEILQALEIKAK